MRMLKRKTGSNTGSDTLNREWPDPTRPKSLTQWPGDPWPGDPVASLVPVMVSCLICKGLHSKYEFSNLDYYFRGYPHEPLYCQNLESLGYIVVDDSMGLSNFKFSWWTPKDACVLKQSGNDPSRSSKVIDFITNRKRVCDFLYWSSVVTLVLSCPVSEIFKVFCWKERPPPLFHPNVGVFPLNQIADVVPPRSEDPKL